MARSNGLLSGKSRNMARHHKPGKIGITTKIKDFKVGDKVVISQKSNFYNIPSMRYKGRIGEVIEKRGAAYVVLIYTSRATSRKIIVPQLHLEKAR